MLAGRIEGRSHALRARNNRDEVRRRLTNTKR